MDSESGLALEAVRVRPAAGGFDLDVSFSVPNGITALAGPSGSGKSTTLALIAGLLKPASGRILLDGRLLSDPAGSLHVAPESRKIAVVFQSLALFPHLSALENVAFGLPRSQAKAERARLARGWLERMKVGELASRGPGTFSGGEAQRVALARALASSPKALLLDEPFSALDDALRSDLRKELFTLVRELGIPTLFVTHDRADARAIADRAIVLSHGRVAGIGPPAEVLGEI